MHSVGPGPVEILRAGSVTGLDFFINSPLLAVHIPIGRSLVGLASQAMSSAKKCNLSDL
jgi:hypothetical protein